MPSPRPLDYKNLPRHIAVIMDGNRRWAKAKGLFALQGHRKGIETVKILLEATLAYKIKYITIFGFSSENWKRSKEEVSGLIDLLKKYIKKETKTFHQNEIRIRFIGSRKNITADIIDLFEKTEQETKSYNKLHLTIAFNYGGRAEITEAAQKIALAVQSGEINVDDINESLFSQYLYMKDMPEPDLLLRTSGEMRVSNFLLWQIAYSEMVFFDIPWPAFTEKNFISALQEYQKRIRRFGGN